MGNLPCLLNRERKKILELIKSTILIQELDSIEQYKLEAVMSIIITRDVSKDAKLDEFKIPEEPQVFETFFGPKI